MKAPVDRRVVDLLEENNRQRFLARRRQAARAQGGRAGGRSRAGFGRSSDVHTPVPGGRPVRAAESASATGFALGLLILIALAFAMGLGLILLALVRSISLGWKRISGRGN